VLLLRARGCSSTRRILNEEVSLDDDLRFRRRLFDLTGGWTVPQIVIDGEPIGGYVELWRLDRSGALEELAA
jgi:glutaredoxin